MERPANPAPSSPSGPPSPVPGWTPALTALLVLQILLLLVVGRNNRHQLNTDGIAYLRLASYYAHGQTELLLSGYWGPLLSWLIAPLLKLGCPPLDAARLVLGGSAVLYWLGSVSLLRRLPLPPFALLLSATLLALQSVFWSVEYISPDLLVAGLMACALCQLLHPRWLEQRPAQIAAGVAWALAYFAKAVAFPLALAISTAVALLVGFTRAAAPAHVARSLGVTLLTFTVLTAPWLAVLSVKYHRPTFSTSGGINHAIVGPRDVDRYHPFVRQFHVPTPGRVTAWEDPSEMAYRPWSPWSSRAYFQHQLQLVQDNLATLLALFLFVSPDWLALTLLALTLVGQGWAPWRDPRVHIPAGALLIALGLATAIYLPVYVNVVDQRYFYFAYTLLVGLGAIAATAWTDRFQRPSGPSKNVVLGGIFAVLLLVPVLRIPAAAAGLPNPAAVRARQLADKLETAGIRGTIAGSGLVAGGRAALYVAYFLNQPWHGDELEPTVARYRQARARLIILNRQDARVTELAGDPAFRNVDARLFTTPAEADAFPLIVFEVVSAAP